MIQLALGVGEVALTVIVQALTVSLVIRYLHRRKRLGRIGISFMHDIFGLCWVMIILFLGHLVQIFMWAVSFRMVGEFADLNTAIYHSAVNYASLGYGDIVMSEEWRILGALEAADGVLMFGVSTATFFAVMTSQKHSPEIGD